MYTHIRMYIRKSRISSSSFTSNTNSGTTVQLSDLSACQLARYAAVAVAAAVNMYEGIN